jgi:hypothetical protein
VFPLYLLDRIGSLPQSLGNLQTLLDLTSKPGTGRRLMCRDCGHLITSLAARIEVSGAHEHSRVNPSGVAYVIGCFRVAPGCTATGERSAHFTWFPGYLWQVELCSRCLRHLGWGFHGEGDPFHGLILERLANEEEGAEPG